MIYFSFSKPGRHLQLYCAFSVCTLTSVFIFSKNESSLSSSSVTWPVIVVELLRNMATWPIYSTYLCWTTKMYSYSEYLGQVHLTVPIPLQVKLQLMSTNLKTSFGHGHEAIHSAKGTFLPGHWLQWVIINCIPNLHTSLSSRWPWNMTQPLFDRSCFDPAQCLATGLSRET